MYVNMYVLKGTKLNTFLLQLNYFSTTYGNAISTFMWQYWLIKLICFQLTIN